MDSTLTHTRTAVAKLLGSDRSGHDMAHIDRVFSLSQKFATAEHADPIITGLIALLHDVDDYKLFGTDHAKNLTNARRILADLHLPPASQAAVLQALPEIGFSKRLQGITPTTLAAKIVSDADMCDVLGTSGILRTYAYGQQINRPFFDPDIFPITNLTAAQYDTSTHPSTGIGHLFEKALRLPSLMLTPSGRAEATHRYQFTIDFLYHFFDENNAPAWREYLDNYLKNVL